MTHTTAFLLHRGRPWLAGLGTLGLCGLLASEHVSDNDGLRAEDVTPELVAQMAQELASEGMPAVTSTGALILDMVEPDAGEGGSETEIAALIGALPVFSEPAGFYSEGEHLYRIEGDADMLAHLAEDLEGHPLVEGIEPELLYTLPTESFSVMDGPVAADVGPTRPGKERFLPNDPMFGLQWHMEQIHAPEAWLRTKGKGVVVAVIDTGVAWKDADGVTALPDLAGVEFVHGQTFVNGALPEGLDDHAHGSHVAGTIAQKTDNGIGVTGVAHEATIMPLKVLSARGSGSVPGIANAIRYAADHGAHVINMSLGSPLPSKVLAKAIEYAHEKGVTVVAAAGNEHRSRVGYPAASAHTIAVAAVDYDRQPTFYSNWGKALDVAAPGGDTRADKNGDGHPDGVLQNTIRIQRPLENDYLWFQGTSMASPHAAGVAALIVASGVTNPDEVERILEDSAVHPGGVKWDERYGAGIIDADAAVAMAQGDGYAPERAGLGGLLGLLGLAGLGAGAATTRRRRVFSVVGFLGGAALASGGLGTMPLAYGIASATGGTAAVLGFGSPLWLSAALPLLLTVGLLGIKPLRSFLTGLSLGWAALLLHGAIVLPTLLTGLPGGPGIDRLWLVANALVTLLLARRISRL